MPVRLDQLPAAARGRALAAAGEAETGRRRTTQLRARGTATYRCPRCPELEPFTTMAAAERHADALGHRRIESLPPPGEKWTPTSP